MAIKTKIALVGSALTLLAPLAVFAAGADVVVDPGQSVAGSLTKDFNGAPVPQVEFTGGNSISGGYVNAEVTGTISDGTLVWRLLVCRTGDGSVRTGQ